MGSLRLSLAQAVLVPRRIYCQLVLKETQVCLTEYLLRVAAAVATTRTRAQQVVQVAAAAKTSIILQKQVLPVKEMLAAYRIVIGMAAAAAVAVRQPLDKTVDLTLVLLSVLVGHRVVLISTPQLVAKAGMGFHPQFLEVQSRMAAVAVVE